MLLEIAAFAKTREQTLELFYIYQGWGESTTPLPINPATGVAYTQAQYGAAMESGIRAYIAGALAHLFPAGGEAPIYVKKAVSHSPDGVSNAYNVTPYYYDDQMRRLEANRDMTFRYVYLGDGPYQDGFLIHKPILWHRKRGERVGLAIVDSQRGNDPDCFEVTSVSIVSGKARLFLKEAADVVLTSFPTIPKKHTTGGVDTFGVVLEVAGKTITSVDNTHAGDSSGPYIEVTASSALTASSGRINITGQGARFCNYRRKRRATGIYQDQDWSGSPGNFASNSPAYNPGPQNDLTPGLAAGSYPL